MGEILLSRGSRTCGQATSHVHTFISNSASPCSHEPCHLVVCRTQWMRARCGDLLLLSICSYGFSETSRCLSLVSSNVLRRRRCMWGVLHWFLLTGEVPAALLPHLSRSAILLIGQDHLSIASFAWTIFSNELKDTNYPHAKDAIQLISHVPREASYLRCATIVIHTLLP